MTSAPLDSVAAIERLRTGVSIVQGLRRPRIDSQGMHIAGTYRADGDVIPSAQPAATQEGPAPSSST